MKFCNFKIFLHNPKDKLNMHDLTCWDLKAEERVVEDLCIEMRDLEL